MASEYVWQYRTSGTRSLQVMEMRQERVVMRLQRAAVLRRATMRQPQWKAEEM